MMIQPAIKHTLTKLATRMYINGQTNVLEEDKSYYEQALLKSINNQCTVTLYCHFFSGIWWWQL